MHRTAPGSRTHATLLAAGLLGLLSACDGLYALYPWPGGPEDWTRRDRLPDGTPGTVQPPRRPDRSPTVPPDAGTVPEVPVVPPPGGKPGPHEPSGDAALPDQCVARCRVIGTDMWSDDLIVDPLEKIECFTINTYADALTVWSLDHEPIRGATELVRGDVRGWVVLSAPIAGDYAVSASCESLRERGASAPVAITARPTRELHVELSWEVPGDANPAAADGQTAADLDLHLLHPNGCWNDATWDCSSRNRSPNWGDVDRADDDCWLGWDDNPEPGPDVITLGGLEEITYRVGVVYGSGNHVGASTATARIYLRGELVGEATSPPMHMGDWWVPFELDGATGAVLGPNDAIFTEVPPCDR